MADVIADYWGGQEGLVALLGGVPADAYRNSPRMARLDAALVEAVNDYQARLNHDARLPEYTATVVTGQQPGLFTGPLYTIYKAITTIRLARRIAERHGVPCTPIFWVASEDHDFDEVRSAHFLTPRHECLTLRYDPAADVAGLPLYRVPVESSLHALIAEAAAATNDRGCRGEVAAFLHESLDASESLADWTARILARLFCDTGLVIFAPHLDAARHRAAPVMERELEEPLQTTADVIEGGEQLDAVGYPPPVMKNARECSFFVEVDNRRRKVTFDGERFRLPEERQAWTHGEMTAMLGDAPERFSPNVALRPVVQQALFAPTAYVAGPGEVAYWAQLGRVFARHEQPRPVVYPRAQALLTTAKLNALLTETGMSVREMRDPFDSLLDRALRHLATDPARHILAEHRAGLLEGVRRLQDELIAHDPTAGAMVEGLERRTLTNLDRIDRTLLYADTKRVQTVARRVTRLRTAFAPWRNPQERVYNGVSFAFEHGWELVPNLLERITIDSCELNEVEL